MDYFTKWPEVYPIPDQEAPTVAEAVVQHWISRYGVPLQLHSDQGRNFVSAVLKGVCELLRIDKTKTTPLHPQSDGMVERFNRTILNNLSLMVSKNQQDWDQKMLFGRDLRLPCDLLFGRPPDTPSSPEEYVQNLQARFEDVHNLARERINLRTEKMKTRYDTKATGHQFKEGDKAVGSLVVRASDSRPEGLGSMLDVTKYPPSAHGFTCRNCGGGDRVVSPSIVPWEVSLSLNRTVTCMVLKANDRRTSCPCHDEFRGPRSDYVRQLNRVPLRMDFMEINSRGKREKLLWRIDKQNSRFRTARTIIIKFGLYAVGKAAEHPPVLAILSHTVRGAKETIAWVGKGIVFDTGGLFIKSRSTMPGMKRDCGGAAGILGAFYLTVKMGFKENLHAIFCLAENAVGPLATRPDDVITLYSGKTVEVNNTDAEGRLVLGDGVAYAKKDLEATTIVDMATLTGAQGVSTGRYHAALVTNSEEWEKRTTLAGKLSGDLIHPMPYTPELHFSEFNSSLADMKNSVADSSCGAVSCAGLFIGAHIGFDYEGNWLHIDMAKTSFSGDKATGYGVALLSTLFGYASHNPMLLKLAGHIEDGS
ncbi:probable aminopeptidase NPEPL1 [Trichonephila clavipes]|nr:probable aminopeptidase NPEPL1 [Trichonephila clavipes]